MSAITLRVRPLGGPHLEVRVFAGPDPDHLALTGTLIMRPDEERELSTMVAAAGHQVFRQEAS